MSTVKQTAEKIKALKIQGATNIALKGLASLKNSKEKDLNKNSKTLANARPTEPLLRNGLRYLKQHHQSVGINEAINEYTRLMRQAKEKSIRVSAERINPDSLIITHCHSTLVIESIKLAKDYGKKPSVIATETRPFYQGRITAKELAKARIPVTVITDSAGNKEISLMGVDGFNMQPVTQNGSINISPAWHPNGKSLLFTCFRRRNPDLYQVFLSTRSDILLSGAPDSMPLRRGLLTANKLL